MIYLFPDKNLRYVCFCGANVSIGWIKENYNFEEKSFLKNAKPSPSTRFSQKGKILECWCKKCGKKLKTKREYIEQNDTCDKCFKTKRKRKENMFKQFKPSPSTGSNSQEKKTSHIPKHSGRVSNSPASEIIETTGKNKNGN